MFFGIKYCDFQLILFNEEYIKISVIFYSTITKTYILSEIRKGNEKKHKEKSKKDSKM